MIEADLYSGLFQLLRYLCMKRCTYNVMNSNIHERVQLVFSHVNEIKTDAAVFVAPRQLGENLQCPEVISIHSDCVYGKHSRCINLLDVVHVKDDRLCSVAFRSIGGMEFACPIYFKLKRIRFKIMQESKNSAYPAKTLFQLAGIRKVQVLSDSDDKLKDGELLPLTLGLHTYHPRNVLLDVLVGMFVDRYPLVGIFESSEDLDAGLGRFADDQDQRETDGGYQADLVMFSGMSQDVQTRNA